MAIRIMAVQWLWPQNGCRLGHLYLRPKIHKPPKPDLPLGNPARGICSATAHPCDGLTTWVHAFLKPALTSDFLELETEFALEKADLAVTATAQAALAAAGAADLEVSVHDRLNAICERARQRASSEYLTTA